MLSQNELLFKYNPFKVKYWKDEEIQEQLEILVDAYIPDESAVMEMALNVENLANQMFLIGEMMARLQEQSNILKADIENKIRCIPLRDVNSFTMTEMPSISDLIVIYKEGFILEDIKGNNLFIFTKYTQSDRNKLFY